MKTFNRLFNIIVVLALILSFKPLFAQQTDFIDNISIPYGKSIQSYTTNGVKYDMVKSQWLNNDDFLTLHVPGSKGLGKAQFFIRNDGSVGIGNSDPKAKFFRFP
ncbi:hypothetical protein [Aquimarina sp. AU119]|uniref:hypothetical protein n=1 Tax=Aquimarina sp. AU119 TaxID=2108528 RepID=UPI0013599278|nr:hypothetical protein [Aquimarina sp. AU119]